MDIAPSGKADNELIITVRKGKKSNTMTFICDQRADLITATLGKSSLFGAGVTASKKSKVGKSVGRCERVFQLSPRGLVQLSPQGSVQLSPQGVSPAVPL